MAKNIVDELGLWDISPQRQVTAKRRAEFWRRTTGKNVHCSLCYRHCDLADGEVGWCKYRRNEAGKMAIPDHGMLARLQRQSLAYDGGFSTYHPGALSMGVGGTRCTSHCVFCTTGNVIWDPTKLPWLPGAPERGPGNDRGWYQSLGMVHPLGVIAAAQQARCWHITLADNEPLLSWEYTFDVARLAKQEGMKVLIYTNGFSEPKAIQKLAPYVDAVNVGLKGSLSENFYRRWMRAPGATEAVKKSVLEWKKAGVYLILSDLVATHIQQEDDEFQYSAVEMYQWIAGEVDPHIPVMHGHMHKPDHVDPTQVLLPPGEDHATRYMHRFMIADKYAKAAGLTYSHYIKDGWHLDCHSCGGLLLKVTEPECLYEPCQLHSLYCGCYQHEQHVTDSKCDHCGVDVPVVALPTAQLQTEWRNARELGELGERQFK